MRLGLKKGMAWQSIVLALSLPTVVSPGHEGDSEYAMPFTHVITHENGKCVCGPF